MRTHDPLLSALLPKQVKTTLHTSAVNPPPHHHLLDFTLQQDVPPLQPLSAFAPPPTISVLLQGKGKPPIIPSTARTYVPLLYALLLRKGVPLR